MLDSKVVVSTGVEGTSNLNILTNNFILKNDVNFNKFFKAPTFINAYSKKALSKIGIEPKKSDVAQKLEYLGEEYFSNLLIEAPKYFFKADEGLVKNGDFSAVGQVDGIAISTIRVGQFLNLLNGWAPRKRRLGRFYPMGSKLPLKKAAKKIIFPFYNTLRKSSKKINICGFDLSLLLRESFIKNLEAVTKKPYPLTKKRLPVVLTHDVDEPGSVVGIKALQEIEQTFGFSSAWYINESGLSNFKEIFELNQNCFSHYTRHDGSLAYTPEKRLLDSLKKYNLNNGFRAPWLHYTVELFETLNSAGYAHDSSMPSYEAFTPFYMPGGCMDIIPFKPILPSLKECNFLEIPITLTQDYGLFNVYGFSPEDSFELQKERIEYIIRHKGLVNIITHPDVKNCGSKSGQKFYNMLLEYISSRKELEVVEIAELIKKYYNY